MLISTDSSSLPRTCSSWPGVPLLRTSSPPNVAVLASVWPSLCLCRHSVRLACGFFLSSSSPSLLSASHARWDASSEWVQQKKKRKKKKATDEARLDGGHPTKPTPPLQDRLFASFRRPVGSCASPPSAADANIQPSIRKACAHVCTHDS